MYVAKEMTNLIYATFCSGVYDASLWSLFLNFNIPTSSESVQPYSIFFFFQISDKKYSFAKISYNQEKSFNEKHFERWPLLNQHDLLGSFLKFIRDFIRILCSIFPSLGDIIKQALTNFSINYAPKTLPLWSSKNICI